MSYHKEEAMRLREMAERLGLDVLVEGKKLAADVSGGYCGDLLSHVLSSARPGSVWITIQQHANVVAVAHVADLAGVLLAGGVRPDEAVLERARTDGVAVLCSQESAFVLAGRLYRLLTDPA